MRKKIASQPPSVQEDFKQKEKLVVLIKEQLQTNKAGFDSGVLVSQKSADPNAGILLNKIGMLSFLGLLTIKNSVDWG